MSKNSINHLAIIMDGNGRWAKQKNRSRAFGHQCGAQTAKKIINDCVKKEISHLTLYTFSKKIGQDQKRNRYVNGFTFHNAKKETKNMLRNNIRFNIVGKIEDLPGKTRDWVLSTIEKQKITQD